MRAAVCRTQGKGARLELGEWPPKPVGRHDCMVRIHAAGVNFPDRLTVEGSYHVPTPVPFVPGLEAAGEVIEIGREVRGLHPGEPVMIDGSVALQGLYAEACVVDRDLVHAVPPGLDLIEAAAFPVVYATGYHALVQRGQLMPGETLLVLGAAGGVGLAALQLGRALGATVIAAASGARKVAALRELGFDLVIDTGVEPLRERVLALTSGRGADVVFDPVGGDQFDAAARCTAREGRLLVIGFAGGRFATLPSNHALIKELSVVGVLYGAWKQRRPAAAAANMLALSELVGRTAIRPHIWKPLPLSEANAALDALGNRDVIGKVVLVPDAA